MKLRFAGGRLAFQRGCNRFRLQLVRRQLLIQRVGNDPCAIRHLLLHLLCCCLTLPQIVPREQGEVRHDKRDAD
jgi:hypothetical protein